MYPPGTPATPDEIDILFSGDHSTVALPVVAATVGGDKTLFTRRGILMGFSARETTGAARAAAQIIDGGDTNGTILVFPQTSSNASQVAWFGRDGPRISAGLFLHVVTGTMDIVMWVRYTDQPYSPA